MTDAPKVSMAELVSHLTGRVMLAHTDEMNQLKPSASKAFLRVLVRAKNGEHVFAAMPLHDARLFVDAYTPADRVLLKHWAVELMRTQASVALALARDGAVDPRTMSPAETVIAATRLLTQQRFAAATQMAVPLYAAMVLAVHELTDWWNFHRLGTMTDRAYAAFSQDNDAGSTVIDAVVHPPALLGPYVAGSVIMGPLKSRSADRVRGLTLRARDHYQPMQHAVTPTGSVVAAKPLFDEF